MPLFRFHKGSLSQSIHTTIIVKNTSDLTNVIRHSYDGCLGLNNKFQIKMSPYPTTEACFDERIGWYTQIVTCDILEKNIFVPHGFLSEPF